MEEKNCPKLSDKEIKKYEKSNYKVFGEGKHSGVKLCRWTKSRLRGGKNCYKSVFGINSHQCVQMTPSLNFCTLACNHCWRVFRKGRTSSPREWDSPKQIVNEAINSQKKLLTGFGGNKNVTKELFSESNSPNHFAISLDGEPTLYPHIPELIQELNSRKFTSFLVTNGTLSHKLKGLLEKNTIPTNLAISVYGTNNEMFKKMTNSKTDVPWNKVLESLDLFKEFNKTNCQTVFWITTVKGTNIDAEGYSKLIKKSEPKFVTLKGYGWTGGSRERLKKENMPTMEEMISFAEEINKKTNYIIKVKDEISRAIILVKDESTWEENKKFVQERKMKKTVAAIIEKDKKFLLMKRKNTRLFEDFWCLPGGRIDENESSVEAVKRETKEETNLELKKPKFFGKYLEDFPEHNWKGEVSVFTGGFSGDVKTNEESSEFSWFSLEELKNLKVAFDHKKILEDFFKSKKP